MTLFLTYLACCLLLAFLIGILVDFHRGGQAGKLVSNLSFFQAQVAEHGICLEIVPGCRDDSLSSTCFRFSNDNINIVCQISRARRIILGLANGSITPHALERQSVWPTRVPTL